MSEFEKRYAGLNENQRRAVDTLDGPVMVVAGPGTGKTELLSVRVANILARTDALPGNILCLTFTDNAAANMRERLVGLLGPDAYKVAIHTFHSFGSEVINTHGDYFYQGAHFRPADELSSYELLTGILEKLPHDNPLASTMNDQFTYLKDIQTTISELKRGGFTPDELGEILKRNDTFIEWVKPKLGDIFGERISKKTIPAAKTLASDIATFKNEPLELSGYHQLSDLVGQSLERAADEADEAEGSTKPLTAWKNTYLEKDVHGNTTLKDEKRSVKLHALEKVYYDYLLAMQKAELYDYDDMILRVVHALEVFDDLRFSLQEQYQYILIDEFQDTNDAQMRLTWNLTNNPTTEGRPNLMVVGDDDQAIYRFQGAELSNILDFTTRYRDVTVIPLTENYRSSEPILDVARSVIVQGTERLETSLENISKVLTPHHRPAQTAVHALTYENTSEARAGLAKQIAADIQKTPSQTRAVIARHHRELVELLPHLLTLDVSVRYERQDDVLSSEPVVQLEQAAHVVWHLGLQEFDEANIHLAELLAHPAWEVPAVELWEISLAAHAQKKYWLEIMLERGGHVKDIAEWLIVGSQLAKTEPLEAVLDYLFGIGNEKSTFSSPYKAYFFGDSAHIHAAYLAHLAALQKIRAGLRDYRPGIMLKLQDFVEYLDLHRELGLSLSASQAVEDSVGSVVLLSAHKAKGLEFDTVYVTDAHDSVWGSGARSRSRNISFPSNLPLSPAGDTDDERLRLLYVALTRAKNNLVLVAAAANDLGKMLLPVGALSDLSFETMPAFSVPEAAKAVETSWYAPLLDVNHTNKAALLKPRLEHYRLNATHLNNYLDVRSGGPEYFLLHNLLKIPEAMSPSAAYGSAIHGALQRAHQHLSANGKKRPVEDVLHDFEKLLQESQLSDLDRNKYLARGAKALTTFLEKRYDSFTAEQIVERNFHGEHIVVGDAVLDGALDLADIDHDEKTIFVTDYKTGKAVREWKGKDDYEKVKLHHYEYQLMMYKLLVENSRQFAGYTVTGARIEFVEPDPRGEIVLLDYTYDNEKLAEFTALVQEVWKQIINLNFSLEARYEPTIKGIVAFEASLK